MPTQIQKIIIAILLVCNYTVNAQTDDSIDKNTIKNYLSKASRDIDAFNLEKALFSISKAQELTYLSKDLTYEAESNYLLAKLHIRLEDMLNAKIHISKAIKTQDKQEDKTDLAKSLIIDSEINIKTNNYNQARKQLENIESIIKKNNLNYLESSLSLNSALLALKKKEPEIALLHLNKAKHSIEFSKQSSYNEIKLNYYKAKAELHNNNTDKALILNNIAMDMSEKMGYLGMQSKTHLFNSIVSEKKGNINTSLKSLKSYQKLNDSLFTISKKIIAQDSKIKFINGDDKIIIEKLKKERTKQSKSIRLGRLTTILSIALITILSLLTLSLYKNNNLRARANELLQNKNNELVLAKENAERASEAKVQFLSTITHELRTPLYAVTGLTHLLLEESPTANQKEHLNSLKFSGEYLLSLINNILDLNKLEANKVEVENTSFNLQKRINDVLIALSKSAKDRNNKLHYEFHKSIPVKLKGDPLKISQILINLIGNSIKFTQNGDIWIKVKLDKKENNRVFLSFEISDNGVGISEKKQQTIFENFTQGSVQINRKFGGTGLGLSIVKNLLSLMGSEIKLESKLGQGSKFYFDLNFEIFEDKSANYQEEVKNINYDIMIDKKVLVVEDNKINQLITRKILEKNKMICDVADNGDIAVNKTKNNEFDLVLMDIHMPGISGIEATRQIREFNSKIPIIALTAVTLDDNLDEFYNNGFNDIIPKPYKTEEFFTKLYKAFSKQKATTS